MLEIHWRKKIAFVEYTTTNIKHLRLQFWMAAITQNCKEAAAGARLLGEIKQTKEKLWKYQHFGGGQKIENGNYFGREKAKIPAMWY